MPKIWWIFGKKIQTAFDAPPAPPSRFRKLVALFPKIQKFCNNFFGSERPPCPPFPEINRFFFGNLWQNYLTNLAHVLLFFFFNILSGWLCRRVSQSSLVCRQTATLQLSCVSILPPGVNVKNSRLKYPWKPLCVCVYYVSSEHSYGRYANACRFDNPTQHGGWKVDKTGVEETSLLIFKADSSTQLGRLGSS